MTAPLFLRRRVTGRPRPVLVEATNRWQITPAGPRRQVSVRHPDGQVRPAFLPDDHPALVRFLDRAAAVAA